MNRIYRSCLSALCLVAFSTAFSACSKKQQIQTTSTYTFVNTLTTDVTVDIYDNKGDYCNETNILKSLKIPPGVSVPVDFEAVRDYWLDWYTADYRINNWAGQDFRSFSGNPSPKFSIATENDKVGITVISQDISRFILLKGNELSSSWRLDVNDYPALNGKHVFTFRRDYTGEHRYTSEDGTTTVTQIRFSQSQISAYSFRMYLFEMGGQSEMLGYVYFDSSPGSTYNYGTDTILVSFNVPAGSSYYQAHRQ